MPAPRSSLPTTGSTPIRQRLELQASSIGLLAKEVLQKTGDATVFASFERSFYLQAGNALIAVVAEDLHDGPLNIKAASAAPLTLDLGIEAGQRWRLSPDHLERSDGLVISLGGATVWRPPEPHLPIDRRALAAGLDALQDCLDTVSLPKEGLVRLTISGGPPTNAVEQAAAPAIGRLTALLKASFQKRPLGNADDIAGLLGLGPGLTPSGDDLLSGVLIACRHLGADRLAGELAHHLLAEAGHRTTAVSQGHLQAAARGYGAAPLHDLLLAVSARSQRGLRQTLDAAAKIGHSSGFDALGGILLTLRCYLGSTEF